MPTAQPSLGARGIGIGPMAKRGSPCSVDSSSERRPAAATTSPRCSICAAITPLSILVCSESRSMPDSAPIISQPASDWPGTATGRPRSGSRLSSSGSFERSRATTTRSRQ